MLAPHVQIEWDGWRIQSVRPDIVLDVRPEPDAPKGRKAAAMADLWDRLRQDGALGVLWQDPDIVTDPGDIGTMLAWASQRPEYVQVAPHKLWPASTGRNDWVWGHGPWQEPIPVMTQELHRHPGWFAMGLTWTPARLLDAAAPDMPAWEYGQTDMGLSRIARQLAIPVMVVAPARPKHMHFYPRKGDLGWPPDGS